MTIALGQPGLVQQTAQIAAARDLTLFVSRQVFNVKHYTQLFDSPHGRRERYGAILRVTLALLWTFYKHLDRDDLTQKAFG